jgi:hypothetical protein
MLASCVPSCVDEYSGHAYMIRNSRSRRARGSRLWQLPGTIDTKPPATPFPVSRPSVVAEAIWHEVQLESKNWMTVERGA